MAIEFIDEDGETIELPVKFEVCPKCKGKGKHDHPAFSNGISAEEMQNEWHPDEVEEYFAGCYDVTCSKCEGLRVVEDVDFSQMSLELQKKWHEHRESMEEMYEMERHEREMGA